MDLLPLILTFAISYLIGSIPFGLLLTRFAGLGDIRAIGSGNIGATNVLRTGRKGLAAATLLLDAGKGLAVVLIMHAYISHLFVSYNSTSTCMGMNGQPQACYDMADVLPLTVWMGFVALLGHCFPIWLKFKGGKGVATALGVALGLNVWLGLIACGTWLAMAATLRYSSLSALVAIVGLPLFAVLLGQANIAIPLLLLALIVVYRHKENIKRLLAGTEPKIGQKK